jgi:hypothetical protein
LSSVGSRNKRDADHLTCANARESKEFRSHFKQEDLGVPAFHGNYLMLSPKVRRRPLHHVDQAFDDVSATGAMQWHRQNLFFDALALHRRDHLGE